MNEVLSVSSVRPVDTNSQLDVQTEPVKTGYTLQELFADDTVDQNLDAVTIQSDDTSASISQSSHLSNEKPISSTPVLDPPERNIQAELAVSTLLSPSQAKKFDRPSGIPHNQITEALLKMSDRTIEQIIMAVLKAQIELEQENAHVAEGTFNHFQKFLKIKEKLLHEIYDALEKDEEIAGKLRTAQNLALGATLICGAAAGLVSFGLLGSVAGGIGMIGGDKTKEIFVAGITFLSSFGVIGSAAFSALSAGSTAYNERCLKQDKAKFTEAEHLQETYERHAEETRALLISIAESDEQFKERLHQMIRRLKKLTQLIHK